MNHVLRPLSSWSRRAGRRPLFFRMLLLSVLTKGAAARAAGGGNETVSVADPRIVYEPPAAWQRYNYTALGPTFVRAATTTASASLRFQGTALYYSSPVFPYDARVLVAIDGGVPSELFLRDDASAGRRPQQTPSGTRTFLLADNLNATGVHLVVVSSDPGDATVYTQVGEFIITACCSDSTPNKSLVLADTLSSKGPRLGIIIPVVIIGVLVLVSLAAGLFFWRNRRKGAAGVLPTMAMPARAAAAEGGGDSHNDSSSKLSPVSRHLSKLRGLGSKKVPPAPPSDTATSATAVASVSATPMGFSQSGGRMPSGSENAPHQDLSTILARPSPHVQRMQGLFDTALSRPGTASANSQQQQQQQYRNGGSSSGGHGQRRMSVGTTEGLVRDIPYLPYLDALTKEEGAEGGAFYGDPAPLPPPPTSQTQTQARGRSHSGQSQNGSGATTAAIAAGSIGEYSYGLGQHEKKASDPFKTPLQSRSASMQTSSGVTAITSATVATTGSAISVIPTTAAYYRHHRGTGGISNQLSNASSSTDQSHVQQHGHGHGQGQGQGRRDYTEALGLYPKYLPGKDPTAAGVAEYVAVGGSRIPPAPAGAAQRERADAGMDSGRQQQQQPHGVVERGRDLPLPPPTEEAAAPVERRTSKRKAVPALHEFGPRQQQQQQNSSRIELESDASETAQAIAALTSRSHSRTRNLGESRNVAGAAGSAGGGGVVESVAAAAEQQQQQGGPSSPRRPLPNTPLRPLPRVPVLEATTSQHPKAFPPSSYNPNAYLDSMGGMSASSSYDSAGGGWGPPGAAGAGGNSSRTRRDRKTSGKDGAATKERAYDPVWYPDVIQALAPAPVPATATATVSSGGAGPAAGRAREVVEQEEDEGEWADFYSHEEGEVRPAIAVPAHHHHLPPPRPPRRSRTPMSNVITTTTHLAGARFS